MTFSERYRVIEPAKVHELKALQMFYDAVEEGRKTFEVRKDDRCFKVGDVLRLREWDSCCQVGGYTGRECRRTITYILSGDTVVDFGVQRGYVVLGLAMQLQSEPAKADGQFVVIDTEDKAQPVVAAFYDQRTLERLDRIEKS